MVIDWETFTFTLKTENEDISYADQHMAWVLDGASGLYQEHYSNHVSDAAWFVYELDQYLKQHLLETKSITEILMSALVELKENYNKFPGASFVRDYPSCAAAIIRRKGNEIEYYIMADCELMYQRIDGKIIRLSDHRVSVFDDQVLKEACKISKQLQKSILECQEYMLQMEIENRKMKNQPKGYYALSDDASICNQALTGICSLDELTSICLCSDGFAQYLDTMKIAADETAFFHDLESMSLSDMHDRLYEKQTGDYDLTKYPRFKLTDDNTIIYGKIKKDL